MRKKAMRYKNSFLQKRLQKDFSTDERGKQKSFNFCSQRDAPPPPNVPTLKKKKFFYFPLKKKKKPHAQVDGCHQDFIRHDGI